VAVASAEHMQICISPQTATPASSHSDFTGRMPSCRPANSVKALHEIGSFSTNKKLFTVALLYIPVAMLVPTTSAIY